LDDLQTIVSSLDQAYASADCQSGRTSAPFMPQALQVNSG
jgi:hypothetical protein